MSRYFVECGLNVDPATEAPKPPRLVLDEAEQRRLHDTVVQIAERTAPAESEEAVLLRIRNALAFLVEARMREMVRDAGRYECPTFQPVLREDAMPLVIVKSKFQVTIPAKLRKGIELREGDIMEATLMGDGILFRPKQVVDRDAAADRISAAVAARPPLPEDVGRSEHEIMQDVTADIDESRRERHSRET